MLLFLLLATAFRIALAGPGPGYPYLAYALPIIGAALFFGRGPGVFAAMAAAALALWLFVPGDGGGWGRKPIDLVANGVFLVGSLALALATDAAIRTVVTLRTVLDGIGEPFYALDAQGRILHASRAALEIWGRDAAAVIGRPVLDALPEARGSEAHAAVEQAMRTRRPMRLEAISRVAGRWVEIDINPAPDGGLSVAFRDIEARRAAEEHQRLLVAELTHRIKNTLAIVLAIADQTRRATASPAEFQEAFRSRILALSRAHDALLRGGGQRATLEATAKETLAPYASEPGRVTITGPPVSLRPGGSIALGMALHELASNAAKHGALSVPGGTVRVSWRLAEAAPGEDRGVVLLWEESGGPAVSGPPQRRGFGMRLLERVLKAEAGSDVAMEFRRTGLSCRIHLAVPDTGAGVARSVAA